MAEHLQWVEQEKGTSCPNPHLGRAGLLQLAVAVQSVQRRAGKKLTGAGFSIPNRRSSKTRESSITCCSTRCT
jgi:hypothetical protein